MGGCLHRVVDVGRVILKKTEGGNYLTFVPPAPRWSIVNTRPTAATRACQNTSSKLEGIPRIAKTCQLTKPFAKHPARLTRRRIVGVESF